MQVEQAYAKVNLNLHVGRHVPGGLHELASLFASLDLADEVRLEPAEQDAVLCPGVEGENLATAALAAFREAAGGQPLRASIDKRIPVAAGLGGGSADAAAVLRGANALAGEPLSVHELREIALHLGSDVPSQIVPRHAIVWGIGEGIERVALPPGMAVVLVPSEEGLSTADVYAEADRIGSTRDHLDPSLLTAPIPETKVVIPRTVENDLQPAALSLRPELGRTLAALVEAGAEMAAITGSGPTAFGLCLDGSKAAGIAARVPGSFVAMLRP